MVAVVKKAKGIRRSPAGDMTVVVQTFDATKNGNRGQRRAYARKHGKPMPRPRDGSEVTQDAEDQG